MTEDSLKKANDLKKQITALEDRLKSIEAIFRDIREGNVHSVSVTRHGNTKINFTFLNIETALHLERSYMEQAIANKKNEFEKLK